MEDQNTTAQVEQLKINVTNIKSFLVKSNTGIKRIDSRKSALLSNEIQNKKKQEAEQKAERSSVPGSGIAKKILSNVVGMARSIKDRILDFFGYLLLGFIVDKLPQIIDGISSFLKTVAPIVTGTVKALGAIANGIGSVYNSISSLFDPEAAKKNIQQSEKELRGLDREMDDDVSVPMMPFVPMAPGSMFPQQTPQASPQISPAPTSGTEIPKIQKRNRGGSVNSASRPNQQPKRSSVGNEKTNPLRLFAKTTEDNTESITVYDKNIGKFEEIVNVLKTIKKFGGKDEKPKDDNPPPPGGRPPIDPFLTPVDVNKDDILGTVGNTGNSFGPHIHIENYSSPGSEIPRSVASRILVGGNPMTSGTKTSGIGWRWGRMHNGEDWDQDWENQPISLTGGLKYVRFIPMGSDATFAGYGNVVVIADNDKKATKYFLAHLNSGPRNEAALRKRQTDPVAKAAGDILKSLERPGSNISPVESRNGALPISVPLGELESKILIQPIIGPGSPGYGNGRPQSNQPQPMSPVFNWNNKNKSNLLGIP